MEDIDYIVKNIDRLFVECKDKKTFTPPLFTTSHDINALITLNYIIKIITDIRFDTNIQKLIKCEILEKIIIIKCLEYCKSDNVQVSWHQQVPPTFGNKNNERLTTFGSGSGSSTVFGSGLSSSGNNTVFGSSSGNSFGKNLAVQAQIFAQNPQTYNQNNQTNSLNSFGGNNQQQQTKEQCTTEEYEIFKSTFISYIDSMVELFLQKYK